MLLHDKDSGRYHKIVHVGVAFTPPHEHSSEKHFRRNATEEIPVHKACNAEGLHQHVAVGGQQALERKSPKSPHPRPRWAPCSDVGGIIGWPGATILLLTAFIPDVILVSIASWPRNLVRGTKRRRQEVQSCPGLR